MKIKLYSFLQKIDLESISEDQCLLFLSEIKWADGFVCRKCGNTHFCAGKKPHSRRCTKCKHEESATSHTMFHNCRLPLNEAFRMIKIISENPQVSSYTLAEDSGRRQMTCWRMKKLVQSLSEGRRLVE